MIRKYVDKKSLETNRTALRSRIGDPDDPGTTPKIWDPPTPSSIRARLRRGPTTLAAVDSKKQASKGKQARRAVEAGSAQSRGKQFAR